MQIAPSTIFELAETQHLLTREWAQVRRRAALVASGPALSIAPRAARKATPLAGHKEWISLHPDGDALSGDLRCAPSNFPIESDSMQLIVVRHVLDGLAADSGMETELARMLAPGGLLLAFGFNPFSPWRLWWSQYSASGMHPPRCRPVSRTRKALADGRLAIGNSEYLGGLWPARNPPATTIDAQTGRGPWQGAWMLTARKEREGMHAIPLRRTRERVALDPGLAQSPSRRVSS